MNVKNLIETISTIEIIDDKKEKENEISQILSKISQFDLDEYLKFFFKGYLWYIIPFESEKRDIEVEQNLLNSIRINKEYINSKVQLAYFYFDKGLYSNVIEILSKLDISIFEKKGQLWKSLKLQELLFASKLNTNQKINSELVNECLTIVTSYIDFPVEELAVPIELIDSVLMNEKKENIQDIARLCLKLVNSTNQFNYFDNNIRKKLKLMIR